MKVDKSKIDYDKLLNDWAEILFAEADKAKEKYQESDLGSYKHGYFDGLHKGYLDSLARLSLLENRKAKKYLKDE